MLCVVASRLCGVDLKRYSDTANARKEEAALLLVGLVTSARDRPAILQLAVVL